MEEELRCPVCKQLFSSPVLLPCYHALCLACALDIQTTANQVHHAPAAHLHQQHSSQSSASSVSTGSSSATESVSSDQDQADKVSILSEADSGVICCTSRPGSYAGTPNLQGLLFPPSGSGSVFSLACPICRKIVFFDELGARNLPLYRAMESIVDRFCEREALRCQMCETEPPKVASVVCEQCEIRYCDGCRELCHPARGPLAKHTLTKPRGASQLRESICGEHNEPLAMYCMGCKLPICSQCMADNRHQSHDLQSIMAMCKAQKGIFWLLLPIDSSIVPRISVYFSRKLLYGLAQRRKVSCPFVLFADVVGGNWVVHYGTLFSRDNRSGGDSSLRGLVQIRNSGK
ncbi:AAEL002637-PA [Aedes aegypti]|uniref:AAEL002637-PA n=1 Tax=Aedes aegypti TaxID=7159 RepID=Q17HK1_AEDAE|nr:AAEL002637-PA [Aedes aegypti]